jgi:hypothetical protein
MTAARNQPTSLRCCESAGAWARVDDLTEAALAGDADAAGLLPAAVNHALGGQRCLKGREAEMV